MCGVWRVHSHNGRGAPARPRPRSLYQLMSASVCVQEVLVNFAQSSVESAEEGALVGGASWRDAVRLDAYTVARKRRAGGKDELGGLPIVGKMVAPDPPPPPPAAGASLELALMPMLDSLNHASSASVSAPAHDSASMFENV